MTSIENSEAGVPKHSGMADLIVKGAIALVTAACFIGGYLQFQMSFWTALIASLSLYIVLMMVHALTRRSEREKELVGELTRLEDEVERLKTSPRGPETASRTRSPSFAPMPPPSPLGKTPPPPIPAAEGQQLPASDGPRIFRKAPAPEAAPALDFSALRPGLAAAEQPRAEPSLSVPGGEVPAEMTAASTPGLPAAPTLPGWNAPPVPSRVAASLHDHWPGRPAKPTLGEPQGVEQPPAERETDLDAVQGMIKRLADEVGVDGEAGLEGLPQPRQESVLRASLNALQTTASAMRAPKKKSGLPGGAAPAAGAPQPPPIMPQHTRLASLAEAIASGRINVSLAPIVGLANQQAHYYEVIAVPRDARGAPLSAGTHDPQLALAGLLPMLDGARLRQSADVARSMVEEGRKTSLFTAATAVSLANDSFLDEIADVYRDREAVAGDLVLTFAQADVRTFGGPEWSALTDMRDLGFRFGVDEVTDFDYEFTALCAAGFAFVKMDAAALLAGLAAPNGPMPADEVCRNLGELGLTLIVTGIDDEAVRAKVVEAGVPLGQGALFGEPLPVGGDGAGAADDAAA